jgi:argonaute-like protein implicated in RNA metabolism and viral defense
VKEKLLNRNITSQCIETDKMLQVLTNDERNNKNYFAYTLQNMAIAINAKLGGIPCRINTQTTKELVVGVGAFKNTDTNIQYIGSAFSFDNTGAFNSFEYFHHDQTTELAGSIEDAIIRFANINTKPNRLKYTSIISLNSLLTD